ncbi:hypothetical protein BS50DRAFT_570105 [Corynespora cassiicola Philippines]|uniref:S-adenosyl-L-methionine-dependent methyltransferase n=1 Tax=Corynespora cassiicola Philippines TaxID=1448308 RepID=A0A2T2P4M0_CORCC|nr:hypothetical protein BS50DRAFT_570105 [Corynespora cassiicola Philippines]
MSLLGHCLPPSSSLPAIRSLSSASEDELAVALQNLHALYCPLRLPLSISLGKSKEIATALADSGYASEDEDVDPEDALAALRADEYEKSFAMRWLTGLLARGEELLVSNDDVRSRMIDDAAFILSSFSDSPEDEAEADLTRDFIFPCGGEDTVAVQLNDAPLSGTDHTDVGLQSWGASIVLSGLLCEHPSMFGLTQLSQNASVVELGAGTGLVSLTLASLFPRIGVNDASIIATDYHPTVLENLRANVWTNFGENTENKIQTRLLDWADPSTVHGPIDVLIAADVVYAPEHAAMLRDCVGQLLSPDGLFWLIFTLRTHGKFEGIADTIDPAFSPDLCPRMEDGRVLRIVGKKTLEKQRGVGRGDEKEYRLYCIKWA